MQTDAELSEIFMRAFILRRMGLIASGHSDVTLVGSRYAGDTLRLREFLTRNGYPYISLDVDERPGRRRPCSTASTSAWTRCRW